jgi:hypothetical protein
VIEHGDLIAQGQRMAHVLLDEQEGDAGRPQVPQ